MNMSHSSKRKSKVSSDLNETLNEVIRSPSTEEINIKDAFEKNREDFSIVPSNEASTSTRSSKRLSRSQSIYRNTSFKNHEVVVTDPASNKDNNNEKPTVNIRHIIKSTVSMNKQTKKHKFIQRFFPQQFEPFEGTSINAMPYQLTIKCVDKNINIKLQVKEHYTIDRVKAKIKKREKDDTKNTALSFNGKLLEGSHSLGMYKINAQSKIQLILCKNITIYGKFEERRIKIFITTSAKINEIKELFAKEISINPNTIELMANGTWLDGRRDLFVYKIEDGFEMDVVNYERKTKLSQGYQLVDDFLKMTNNLQECTCEKKRNQTMADLIKSMIDESVSTESVKREFLRMFDPSRRYHHRDCFKVVPSPRSEKSSVTEFSAEYSAEFSGSDNSFKSAVKEDNERRISMTLDDDYIKLLSECEEFTNYKHLLREKIGTKCDLRSVALLYKYTRYIVRYIGFDGNEYSKEVKKIIEFSKLYFNKYFMNDILDKGGLDALILNDID